MPLVFNRFCTTKAVVMQQFCINFKHKPECKNFYKWLQIYSSIINYWMNERKKKLGLFPQILIMHSWVELYCLALDIWRVNIALRITKKPIISINVGNIHVGVCFVIPELLSIRDSRFIICSRSMATVLPKEHAPVSMKNR